MERNRERNLERNVTKLGTYSGTKLETNPGTKSRTKSERNGGTKWRKKRWEERAVRDVRLNEENDPTLDDFCPKQKAEQKEARRRERNDRTSHFSAPKTQHRITL